MKIGDRVVGVGNVDGVNIDGLKGTIKGINPDAYEPFAIEFDESKKAFHSCKGLSKNRHGWYVKEDNIRPFNETIVIYRKDNEVIALDKSTGKKAVAKCDPRDQFDFKVGAKLALERLTSNVTFRVLAIENNLSFFKRGDILEFIDGQTKWIDGVKSSHYKNFDDFISFNPIWKNKVVELKEGDDPEEILKKYVGFKIGDIVEVINKDRACSNYKTWEGLKGYESHFVRNKLPVNGKEYKIVNIDHHEFYKCDYVLIQDLDTTQVFIINKKGLKLVENILTPNEMRDALRKYCAGKSCSNCQLHGVEHCYEFATPDELKANYEKVFGKGGVR